MMANRTDINFSEWLLLALEEREWSQADLARAAGVSKAAISDIISGRRNVGKDAATSMANALKLPPEQVFRAAGLLPPAIHIDEELEQILHEIEKLPKSDREEILAFIRMKNNLRKRK